MRKAVWTANIIFLALVLFSLALLNQDAPMTAPQEDCKQVHVDVLRPYEYKMFYGEWVVTRVVDIDWRHAGAWDEESIQEAENKATEELVGQTVYYDYDVFISNGIVAADPVYYRITILPVTDKPFIINRKPPDMLGIIGDYFVFVMVDTTIDTYGVDIIGKEFYIIDDETLIINEGLYGYEMKRKTHIDGYLRRYELF